MIRPRDDEGNVANTQMYELTGDMESPMPMELMYIQRLRLLFHLMQVADDFMIHAVIKKLSSIRNLKARLKKAQKAHLIKVRTYCELRSCAQHQETVLKEMGWSHDDDGECETNEPDRDHVFSDCEMQFKDEASLATHQQ